MRLFFFPFFISLIDCLQALPRHENEHVEWDYHRVQGIVWTRVYYLNKRIPQKPGKGYGPRLWVWIGWEKKRIDLKHPPSILSLSLSLISMASIAACIVRIEKLIFRRHG